MKAKYYTIEQMLEMIDESNQSACFQIFKDNLKLFQIVQGSTNNHQNWSGGYFDHVQEVMNVAVVLYRQFNFLRSLPFSLSDLLLVVYLHDIEKPWKYELDKSGKLQHKASMGTKDDQQKFRMEKLAEYGIKFTPEQENGMKYAEGELHDYTNQRRVMGPLAAMVHMCDIASARLWSNYPLEEKDSWSGAKRIRN